MQKGGEQAKDGEDMELRDKHHLCGVHEVPMTELVG